MSAKYVGVVVLYVVFTTVFVYAKTPPPQSSSFEDVRCKCVCPKTKAENGTKDRNVYISANVDPNMCKCDLVVDNPTVKKCAQWAITGSDDIDQRKTWQLRILFVLYLSSQVVVIFIICVVSLLLVYMMFLLCLDPIIARKPSAGRYQEHSNEERNGQPMIEIESDDQSVRQVPREEQAARAAHLTRQRSIVNRVTDEQAKWKDTVSEQRKIIYDRHSMLN
ncbi:hypothetical protein KUTeg_007838 [Tegillarca granosa]|uniref:Uncharacterized protein n=1 Tax=Tegillarca granosa TaxID=220873 RepID=A0ABQ9FIY4_TEGGR|nr:hypothetical protein KUTeg_007838 [Tegillarca granosa]